LYDNYNKRITGNVLMQTEVPQKGARPAAVLPDTEDTARDYLISAGVLRALSHCPACGSSTIRYIRRNQCRCRDCRHEWSLRNGTILEGQRISFRTFLSIIRYFADDLPANEAARRIGISYNTVYEVYQRIRDSVLVPALPDNSLKDEQRKKKPDTTGSPEGTVRSGTSVAVHPAAGTPPSHTRNSSTGICVNGTPPRIKQVIYGIRLHDGDVTIYEVNCPDPEIILALPIPNMQRGNILFLDAYGKKYQGFITYMPDRHGRDIVRIRARDGLPWSPLGDFWTFAGRAWTSHRGIEREHIPEFVQELSFRYNHRHEDILPLVLAMIAASYTRT
jgi:transposase